jgi:hypothetical protein
MQKSTQKPSRRLISGLSAMALVANDKDAVALMQGLRIVSRCGRYTVERDKTSKDYFVREDIKIQRFSHNRARPECAFNNCEWAKY